MNAMTDRKRLPTDQWIDELVGLYTTALGTPGSDAAVAAAGLEKAALLAAGAEAEMIKAVVAERLAFARMKVSVPSGDTAAPRD